MGINKAMNHLNNLITWKVDTRVLHKIQDTGFDRLLQLTLPVRHNLSLISALINSYNVSETCFVFGSQRLLFSLEDLLYITGLPVDGKPITGIDAEPTMLSSQFLGSNGCKDNTGELQFKWLKSNFELVPKGIDGDSSELEPYVRAYLLYVIGSVVFPDKAGGVSVIYLSLLENIDDVKNYAWGAGLLAHLHVSLAKAKKEGSSRVQGNTYALMIFALEHVPKLASAIFDHLPAYPMKFPLLEGWTKLLFKPSKNNFKQTNFREIIQDLDESDIVWQPYKRLPADFLPDYCAGQEKLGKCRTILLCFDKAAYHRPDLCPKQFGIQAVNTSLLRPLVELKLRSRSGPKGSNWQSCAGYGTYVEEWKNRGASLIDNLVEQGERSMSTEGFPEQVLPPYDPLIPDGSILEGVMELYSSSPFKSFMDSGGNIDKIRDVATESPCSSGVIPILWPSTGILTLDWMQNLMSNLDWSSRNLSPSDFPSVLPLHVFNSIILSASRILHKEPNCVRVDDCGPGSSVIVVGDVYGQLHDVLFVLERAGLPSEGRFLIFNGNYVDKGAWGLETFLLLLALKVFMPDRVYLLRGNHESQYCTSLYGFEKEVMTKYGGSKGNQVYRKCLRCFEGLPLASIVAGRVYTTHGGLFRSAKLTPSKRSRGKTNELAKENCENISLSLGSLDELSKAKRSVLDPPWEGLNLIPGDVLWSGPSMIPGLSLNKERGIGLLWGPDCTDIFLKKYNLKLIIRSHEGPDVRQNRPDFSTLDEGYSIDHVVESGQLITLFSAPDYPQFQGSGERYKNKGAYIVLESPDFDTPTFYSFEAVTPRPEVNPYYDYIRENDSHKEVNLAAMVPSSKRAVFSKKTVMVDK